MSRLYRLSARGLSTDSRAGKVLVSTYGPPTGVRTLPGLMISHGKGAVRVCGAGVSRRH
jgi:hypothetical protein